MKANKALIEDLLKNQRFGVIATQSQNEPYTSLIAFACCKNLKNIIFSTNKNTKKYDNIIKNSRMTMLIDNRGNTPDDIKNAMAVTAIGSANEVINNKEEFLKIYLDKHPYLKGFIKKPDNALIILNVEKYIVVNRFQKVGVYCIKRG